MTERWEYRNWFHKPPLFIWITALVFAVFQVSELWARAASVRSAVGLVLLTFVIGTWL